MKIKLSDIVKQYGGILEGDDLVVTRLSSTNVADIGSITFLTDKKYFKLLDQCRASAIIINSSDRDVVRDCLAQVSLILTDNPYLYYSKVVSLFHPYRNLAVGVSDTVTLGQNSVIGDNPAIASHVSIADDVVIGNNCQIHASVAIGHNVKIGHNVIIYPNVTIYSNVVIGDNCTFHSGCVIGADGFGYAPDKSKVWNKIPQVGGVIIGSNVDVGANTTIDSGALEPTIIEDGVKIDNLVQIAHNVKLGAHTAIAANTGIAGGTVVGKHCQIGGGTNITGHIKIADYTVIGAASGISKDITKPDLYSSAIPAINYRDWARTVAYIRNLDQTNDRIKKLELAILELQKGSVND